MSWAKGSGTLLGDIESALPAPARRAPGNQTDPADTRAGPLGEAVHHSRGPRQGDCPAEDPGQGAADALRASGTVGWAHRGQRRAPLWLRPLLHRRGAAVHHRPIPPDDSATRTAGDDGGARPDRWGIRWRHARRCDRAKEVDGADCRRLCGVRTAGRVLGLDADAADGPAIDRCDHRRVGGRRPGVRCGIGAGRDARIIGDRLSTRNRQRHHPRLPGRLPACRHAQLAMDLRAGRHTRGTPVAVVDSDAGDRPLVRAQGPRRRRPPGPAASAARGPTSNRSWPRSPAPSAKPGALSKARCPRCCGGPICGPPFS